MFTDESAPLDKRHLLPAWFCERMLSDGRYAIVMHEGLTVAITRILNVHQDASHALWIDVLMMPLPEAEVYLGNGGSQARPIVAAMGAQRRATLNAANILLAYELQE